MGMCDLNPVARELAEVSLWLNCIHRGGHVPWFGLPARLRQFARGGAPAVVPDDDAGQAEPQARAVVQSRAPSAFAPPTGSDRGRGRGPGRGLAAGAVRTPCGAAPRRYRLSLPVARDPGHGRPTATRRRRALEPTCFERIRQWRKRFFNAVSPRSRSPSSKPSPTRVG